MKYGFNKVVILLLGYGLSSNLLARVDNHDDYKQSVKEYSSNTYLTQAFKDSVERRAKRVYTYVKNTMAQNEKVLIKAGLSKHHALGVLDSIDWDILIWSPNLRK